MTKTIKCCPKCGSEDVQNFVAYWENPNTGAQDEYGLAEAYPELHRCEDCGVLDRLADANDYWREVAGNIVAKHARFMPYAPAHAKYSCSYDGHRYYAGDTDALANKIAIVLLGEQA